MLKFLISFLIFENLKKFADKINLKNMRFINSNNFNRIIHVLDIFYQ